MKRRLLIVFPSYHLAYSPTTINLYDLLSDEYSVTVIAPLPPYEVQRLESRQVEYVQVPRWASRIAESVNFRLRKYLGWNAQLGRRLIALLLRRAAVRFREADAVGVDFVGMWVVQQVFGCGHMVSLELESNDPFRRLVDLTRIKSVITQTQSRYDYLFAGSGVRCFLVQNAPIYRGRPKSALPPASSTDLLYCGTAVPGFGIYRCLDFLVRYPEFRLTIQGAVSPAIRGKMNAEYAELLATGRLYINDQYLEGPEMIEYASRFAAGFCCYDFTCPEIDNFNYRSAPSGKLFTYYAAGVPVIGSDIPGLASVREFGAGALIPDFTPEAVRAAVHAVLSERDRLSANCLRAAEHFSFEKALVPWIDFLRQSARGTLPSDIQGSRICASEREVP